METPECDKALKIQDESNNIGFFLDWLQEQDIHLCSPHNHTEPACYRYGDRDPNEDRYISHDYAGQAKYIGEKELDCGSRQGEMICVRESFEKLLARYFNIDLNKIEKEKQAILKEIRGK